MIQFGCAGWLVLTGLCAVPFHALGMSTNSAFGAGAVLASVVVVAAEFAHALYRARRRP